jgi:hypothetical protein
MREAGRKKSGSGRFAPFEKCSLSLEALFASKDKEHFSKGADHWS